MKPNHSPRLFILLLLPAVFLSCHRRGIAKSGEVQPGVPLTLASYRRQVLSNIRYQLFFRIPEKKDMPIAATETLLFHLEKNRRPLLLDFKEKETRIKELIVNGAEVPVVLKNEHLVLDPAHLKKGGNSVAVRFTAGDLSLNRNEDFLYTLLVPDRARTAFPCFDQPDLKATFTLSLTVPRHWKALGNAPLKDSMISGNEKTLHYFPTDTISTYLFSFAAGEFVQVKGTAGDRPVNFYHRETDRGKVTQSVEPVISMHAASLRFLQEYTRIPFPFRKFDFMAIPDFQYGGMEHPGAILYKASSLFLDEGATRDQKIARSGVIAHETAHMWFGNLVTMRWFDDVWMKEVFANFLADKIVQQTDTASGFDLKFLLDHLPAAYSVDRTEGANPVRQPLANLQDAGSLYGSIIYHKAPVIMRQLERLMGAEAFRNGLGAYLNKYAYGNASWPDLIRILDAHTPARLKHWNKVWVDQPGRPRFDYELTASGGNISGLVVRQSPESGSRRVWPQAFELALVYPDRVEELTVSSSRPRQVVREAVGKPVPLFILFNSSGQGYGLFPAGPDLRLNLLKSSVARASACINLYENMLAGRGITPRTLLNIYRGRLSSEPEELNLRLVTGQLADIFWHYTLPEERASVAADLETGLWKAMEGEREPGKKKILFKTYQGIASGREALDRLHRIWQVQRAPEGVRLSEDDYTSLALSLAVRDYPAPDLLLQQLGRLNNPDRRKRLEFILPALSPDVRIRDDFFRSLKEVKNREKESWVLLALDYLHHPLRAATSRRYLKESLELLEELQRTGDIFFPHAWLQKTLGRYQSPGDAAVVRTFLKEHPLYPRGLKEKILQAADPLFRAEQLLYGEK